jgi:hypothetical protein
VVVGEEADAEEEVLKVLRVVGVVDPGRRRSGGMSSPPTRQSRSIVQTASSGGGAICARRATEPIARPMIRVAVFQGPNMTPIRARFPHQLRIWQGERPHWTSFQACLRDSPFGLPGGSRISISH